MLEPGRRYKMTVLEDHGEDGLVEALYTSCAVVTVVWPLVKFENGEILNLSSPRFVKAEPRD
ncbi:MAG: hypothetical protein OXG51_10610 [Gammaproteobacteria bacterium]|nr:hypothetical protein [Gammaproteobacteria bacterium]